MPTLRPPLVVVLCSGNVNRSPFCARLFQQLAPQAQVYSYALKGPSGLRAAAKTRRHAAERYGLDLEKHRSCHVDDRPGVQIAVLRKADLVLVMNAKQATAAEALGCKPAAIRNLQAADPGYLKESDPRFARVYVKLHDAITELAASLPTNVT